MKLLLLLSLLFCTSSCGWHLANQPDSGRNYTVSIPFAHGDTNGLLTQELAQAVERSSGYTYLQTGGEFDLKVEILDEKSENIGYQFNPRKLEDGKRKLNQTEARRTVLAKVELCLHATDKCVLGPAYIRGMTEFDHLYYNVSHDSNTFSLGQLTDIDTAYDAVSIPLYRSLAQNIAEYLANTIDVLDQA